uniref:Adrenomedullin n=1 Tax=Echeneis naucrates TaxID=173247 RepID=A0A665WNS1_ECHNA
MRLFLHTVICCCVFTMAIPLVSGAKEELNSSLKKRFKVWLQGRMKRDLGISSVTASEEYTDNIVTPQQNGQQDDAKTIVSPLSFGLRIRPRRSLSKGCVLVTCVYNDLIHKLHKIQTQDQKEPTPPAGKMTCNGYGRRRRSLLPSRRDDKDKALKLLPKTAKQLR